MLFDLQGKRRRVVQITYIGLALLMGGGLVLSGIGSDAGGGILDALVGSGGGGEGDVREPIEKQKEEANKRLAANPKDPAALSELVRANFQLAGLETTEADGQVIGYNQEGEALLREADAAWGRYLDTNPEKIDSGLATTAIAIYDALGPPEQKERYVRPARELAEQENTTNAYLKLFQVATTAGDPRTAGLAERKALALAESKDERDTIKQQIDELKQAASGEQGAGGNGAAPQSP
jgi:hypothetical protein